MSLSTYSKRLLNSLHFPILRDTRYFISTCKTHSNRMSNTDEKFDHMRISSIIVREPDTITLSLSITFCLTIVVAVYVFCTRGSLIFTLSPNTSSGSMAKLGKNNPSVYYFGSEDLGSSGAVTFG